MQKVQHVRSVHLYIIRTFELWSLVHNFIFLFIFSRTNNRVSFLTKQMFYCEGFPCELFCTSVCFNILSVIVTLCDLFANILSSWPFAYSTRGKIAMPMASVFTPALGLHVLYVFYPSTCILNPNIKIEEKCRFAVLQPMTGLSLCTYSKWLW